MNHKKRLKVWFKLLYVMNSKQFNSPDPTKCKYLRYKQVRLVESALRKIEDVNHNHQLEKSVLLTQHRQRFGPCRAGMSFTWQTLADKTTEKHKWMMRQIETAKKIMLISQKSSSKKPQLTWNFWAHAETEHRVCWNQSLGSTCNNKQR